MQSKKYLIKFRFMGTLSSMYNRYSSQNVSNIC